jgi:hypothetical protein
LNSCKTIKNKIIQKKHNDTKDEDQSIDKTINHNKDYEYIYESFDEPSSKPKKHIKYNRFKTSIATIKNKYFYKNKSHSNKYNLQTANAKYGNSSLSMNNAVDNDYNIKATSRLLDKEGYEVPICQQKKKLSNNDKQNITSINNTDPQDSENTSTRKLQATSVEKLIQKPKDLKHSSATNNQDGQTLNDLKGIVHERVTMFEKNYIHVADENARFQG